MKRGLRTKMITITPQFSILKAHLVRILAETFTVHKLKLYRLRDLNSGRDKPILDAYLIIEPLTFGIMVNLRQKALNIANKNNSVLNLHFWEKPPNTTHKQSVRLFNGMIKQIEIRAENYLKQKD